MGIPRVARGVDERPRSRRVLRCEDHEPGLHGLEGGGRASGCPHGGLEGSGQRRGQCRAELVSGHGRDPARLAEPPGEGHEAGSHRALDRGRARRRRPRIDDGSERREGVGSLVREEHVTDQRQHRPAGPDGTGEERLRAGLQGTAPAGWCGSVGQVEEGGRDRRPQKRPARGALGAEGAVNRRRHRVEVSDGCCRGRGAEVAHVWRPSSS